MADWLSQLWDTLTSVSVPVMLLGLAFQTAQTCLVALAWRNILRVSYPDGGVNYRDTLGYYAGGNGLNAILPASAGTVAMLGLFRTSIEGSTVAGLVGATVVQNIFFAVVGGLVYLWLFLSVAGSFDVKLCKRLGRMLKTCGYGEVGFTTNSRAEGRLELRISDMFSTQGRVEYVTGRQETAQDSLTRGRLELKLQIPLGY